MRAIRSSRTAKIVVDVLMTIFLVLSFIRWEDSNFAFHAVVGSVCTLLFVLHICIHHKWIKAVTKSFLAGNLSPSLRWKYTIDILLLIVWGVAIVTGFLAIGYFSAGIEGMATFSRLHGVTSRIGLGLIVVHIFQHFPQIKSYLGIKSKQQGAKAR
ncbi:MAG: hypothetical protein FWE19_02535 [Oscillospiraceae bacterium]|nr:hypothetical protein [Oscillospiraceae bacterium]